jgi:ADP-ribosylglycohydrolase
MQLSGMCFVGGELRQRHRHSSGGCWWACRDLLRLRWWKRHSWWMDCTDSP